MYTNFSIASRRTKFFEMGGLSSSPEWSHETTPSSPEAEKQIQQFAQRVQELFAENPEMQQSFIDDLDTMKNGIFQDPEKFNKLIDALYKNHTVKLESIPQRERIQTMERFSDFITKITLQFASMHHIESMTKIVNLRYEQYKQDVEKTTKNTQSDLNNLKSQQ